MVPGPFAKFQGYLMVDRSVHAKGVSIRLRRLVETNYGTFRGFVRLALGQIDFAVGRLDKHLHPQASQTERLVFVCLGNINRSAFGEWVARKHGATVCSIGLSTTTGAPAFPSAVKTATQFGIDLSSHAATDLKDYEYRPGDLLLVMEIRHAKKLIAHGIPEAAIAFLGNWAAPHRIHLHDPHTLSDVYFQTCFTLINSAVQNLVAELRSAESPCVPR